jgi:NADH-quinone oxidoreductase subunit I
MIGEGIAKGMWLTLTHFVDTYVQDVRYLFRGSQFKASQLPQRQAPRSSRGLFTVEYPKERLQMSENFRVAPFLVYNSATGKERCTSCGICAKVCPPQCIWIVRSTDPATGRPQPDPAEYYIDGNICMNCGLCAEFCPFDAIKMDHNYELASFGRDIFDKAKLSKPTKYYESIRPDNSARENAARAAKLAARKVTGKVE